MKTCCTIITRDHAPYAISLFKSLHQHDESISLQVLIADEAPQPERVHFAYPGMKVHLVQDVLKDPLAEKIYNKYFHIDKDSFRWAFKPLFISYLLHQGFEQVIYLDADIFFYQPIAFL